MLILTINLMYLLQTETFEVIILACFGVTFTSTPQNPNEGLILHISCVVFEICFAFLTNNFNLISNKTCNQF